MKIERLVMIVLIVFVVYMGGVFVYGFVQKQQKESQIENMNTQNSQQATTPSVQPEPTTPAITNTTLTDAEVAKHSTKNDCYIIISDQVYDVGAFLDLHPAGADLIVPFCGSDATRAFETQNRSRGSHSQSARNMLQRYLIGPLQ